MKESQAKIIIEDWQGRHNITERYKAIQEENLYRDSSTICIIPSPDGIISARIVQNWMGMMPLMNQKFTRIFMIGLEVAEAYNQAIEMILANPELSSWQFIMTLEHDNLLPPDALIKLIKAMYDHPEYDVIGGLYWTKGEGGQPMCYGDPKIFPKNFIPQVPPNEGINEYNGLGMGCNLFRMSMFKEEKIKKPWFKTRQEYIPGVGCVNNTQDLYFYDNAGKAGYRFACHGGVKVGHYSVESDIVW